MFQTESLVKKIEEITITNITDEDPALSKVKVTVTENGHDEEITATS